MNRYGQLDQQLRVNHAKQLSCESSSEYEVLLAEEEKLGEEMDSINLNNHNEVETYRKEMGWKPCLECQRKMGWL